MPGCTGNLSKMNTIPDLIDWVRNLAAQNEQRERDRRRREHQGRRDGYAHSGEPSPVPVYMAPPAPGGQRAGISTNFLVAPGGGGALLVDIDALPSGTTWVYVMVSRVTAGGIEEHVDKDFIIYAMDGSNVLATIAIFEAPTGHATGGYHSSLSFRVPATRLRLALRATTAGDFYRITGVWEEDR